MVDPNDGWPMFVDGWGRPIVWLRGRRGAVCRPPGMCNSTVPVFSYNMGISNIQLGDPGIEHDPFDPRNIQPGGPNYTCPDPTNPNSTSPIYPRCGAFQLIPLILSAAGHKITDPNGTIADDYGVALGNWGSSTASIYPAYPVFLKLGGSTFHPHSHLGLFSFDEMPSGVLPPPSQSPPPTPLCLPACARSVRQLRLYPVQQATL